MLTTGFFGEMTTRVMQWAAEHCQGRVVSVLEGGYNKTTLMESVAAHLQAMIGDSSRNHQ